MAKVQHIAAATSYEKDFLKLFDQLTYCRSGWQVWEDLVTVMACSIANSIDQTEKHFEKREKQYEQAIKSLGGVEIPAKMFAVIVNALEENPDQDFLGKLYMNLNLGSHWHGQFFTPYHVCECMARMQIEGPDVQGEIERKGYISICDPCVGGGAMLIAAASAFRRLGINYQDCAVFVGQDLDPVVAKMAFIQISLLGCPGYITVANTLTNPQTGPVLFPHEGEGQEVWITPMFMSRIWELRRTKEMFLGLLGGTETTVKTVEKEHDSFYFYFDFREQEVLQHE